MQSFSILECFPFQKRSIQQTIRMPFQNRVCSLPPPTPNNLQVTCFNADAALDFYSVYIPIGYVPLTDYSLLAPQVSSISTALVRFSYSLMYKNTLFSEVVPRALINKCRRFGVTCYYHLQNSVSTFQTVRFSNFHTRRFDNHKSHLESWNTYQKQRIKINLLRF